MANEKPALEEYWEALRGKPKVAPKKRQKLEVKVTPERAGMVSQEERDRAIIARSDHLRAANYYKEQSLLTPEEEEEEQLRQAILNRAPYMAEWVTSGTRRVDEESEDD